MRCSSGTVDKIPSHSPLSSKPIRTRCNCDLGIVRRRNTSVVPSFTTLPLCGVVIIGCLGLACKRPVDVDIGLTSSSGATVRCCWAGDELPASGVRDRQQAAHLLLAVSCSPASRSKFARGIICSATPARCCSRSSAWSCAASGATAVTWCTSASC